jgi:hypothetical protein
MLAFAVLYSLKLTQMLEFAESISAFQPCPLDHWRRPIVLSRSFFFGV